VRLYQQSDAALSLSRGTVDKYLLTARLNSLSALELFEAGSFPFWCRWSIGSK